MASKNFLTIEEVADTLSVTRQTVSKYIREKELNAVRINKNYRIPYKDFENFINRNTTVSDVETIYLKKSRNCLLGYEGRVDENEILNYRVNGAFQENEINHQLRYNKFISGDNFSVLKHLLPNIQEKVDLIYIDPPFGTGQDYVNINNDLAYNDTLVNHEFLEFMRKRLMLLRKCLSDQGSIYLHIDKKLGHYVKIIMDEVFGYNNFINDITRIKCNPKNFARNAYGNYSDMILFYVKNRDLNIFNDIKEPLSEEEVNNFFPKVHSRLGKYTTNPLHAPGITIDGDTGQEWNGLKPPKGRHWRYSREELTRLDMEGLIEWSETGNPRKMVFAKDHKGKKVQDVWEFKDKGLSYVNYPTQKNHDLLKRIILNSSNEGSLVLDCFAGSGGTLLVANRLRRQWIGIDNSLKSLEAIKENFSKAKVKCNYFSFVSFD
ncbi:MAG: helix-turn-helix domain-containing protein [Bacteroidetes bacterium]|nr:helix-turn-helix domain-containing protein [Bacteroidota bacterium]MBL7103432.1 helix-turn-helix domain-containing protein [Bacteroidales bacterium]